MSTNATKAQTSLPPMFALMTASTGPAATPMTAIGRAAGTSMCRMVFVTSSEFVVDMGSS